MARSINTNEGPLRVGRAVQTREGKPMAFYHEGYPNRGDGTERDRSMGTRAATAHQAMRVFLLAGVLLSVASSALAAVAPSFQILSTPASFVSNVEAVGVSADGKVIIW